MRHDKEIIVSTVHNGKLEPWKGRALVSAIGAYEGKIVAITVTQFFKPISGKQLRFINGVFLPALYALYTSHGNQVSPDAVRDSFKDRFGPKEQIIHPDGTVTMEPKSMKEWTREEASDAAEKARAHYAPYGELPFPTSANEGDENADQN